MTKGSNRETQTNNSLICRVAAHLIFQIVRTEIFKIVQLVVLAQTTVGCDTLLTLIWKSKRLTIKLVSLTNNSNRILKLVNLIGEGHLFKTETSLVKAVEVAMFSKGTKTPN